MADIERFAEYVSDELSSNIDTEGLIIFSDQKFKNIGGWCVPQTMFLLNVAISFLEEDEYYLEIGSYCGKSVIAALDDNSRPAIVIEAFEKHLPDGANIRRIWNENVNKFGIRDRILLINEDCNQFEGWLPPIGLFYFDGNHDSGYTYEGLKRFEKYLSDQAIIIVDDYNIVGGTEQKIYPGYSIAEYPVKTDVNNWIQNNSKAKLIHITDWLNGQAIITYDRSK